MVFLVGLCGGFPNYIESYFEAPLQGFYAIPELLGFFFRLLYRHPPIPPATRQNVGTTNPTQSSILFPRSRPFPESFAVGNSSVPDEIEVTDFSLITDVGRKESEKEVIMCDGYAVVLPTVQVPSDQKAIFVAKIRRLAAATRDHSLELRGIV